MRKFFLFFFLLFFPSLLHAHAFSRSTSHWYIAADGATTLVFLTPLIAAESVPFGDASFSAARRFADHLSATLRLHDGTGFCAVSALKVRQIKSTSLRARMDFQCKSPISKTTWRVALSTFFDSDPSHIHFANFFFNDQRESYLFSSQSRSHQINLGKTTPSVGGFSVFLNYITIGISHILIGIDHLAFLVALLLLGGTAPAIFWAITGFTLGHSLTLGLAAAGIFHTNINVIEALIGFTVLLMALEYAGLKLGYFRKINFGLAAVLAFFLGLSFFVPSVFTNVAWAGLIMFVLFWGFYIRDEDHARQFLPFLSTLFGLIHGGGFAAALNDIGLPQAGFLPALAGFNIGVELGQLIFVLAIFMGIFLLRPFLRESLLWRESPYLIMSLLTGLGVYWFTDRVFF